MEQKYYLVDTCVFISAFRGNAKAVKLLTELKGKIAVSSITIMELYLGAKTAQRKKELSQHISKLPVCHLTTEVSVKAMAMIKRYVTSRRTVGIPDCIIASTAIENNYPLVTYNKKDFDFIHGLDLYK